MFPLHLYEIIKAVKGRVINYRPIPISRISTDSRSIKKGDLFVALKGDNFDGHNFIKQAIKQGAATIILSSIPKGIKATKTPLLKVKDTLLALGDIARYYRRRLAIPVIAVGGSNGKTTTKDMIAHILSKKARVTKSYKSFNNFIGLPLTILSADEKTQYLVAEVGTNKPGEIRYLAEILRPDIAVITNISVTHLDGLKNLNGVFKEESSLFNVLKSGNIAVFDATNKGLKRLAKYAEYSSAVGAQRLTADYSWQYPPASAGGLPHYKSVTFSTNSKADIRSKGLKISPSGIRFTILGKGGHYDCFIPVLGSWNIKNALAAFAAVQLLGLKPREICKALKDFKLPGMRMERRIKAGVTFINDAYNANPVSVGLVIDELSAMKSRGRKILVFGEMKELDRYTRRFHEAAADNIAQSNIDMLVAIGPETRWTVNRLLRTKTICPKDVIPVRWTPKSHTDSFGAEAGIHTPSGYWIPAFAGMTRRAFRKNPVFYYETVDEAIPTVKKMLKPGDTVLLKGSRANALEKIIN